MKKSIKVIISVCVITIFIGSASLVAFAATDDNVSTEETITSEIDGSASLGIEKVKGSKVRKSGSAAKSGVHVDVLTVAASVLGKTTDEIKGSVKDSKVGDLLIAADKVDAFKTAYLTALKTKLDTAITAGMLTQAEADENYTAGKEKMDAYDGTTHLCGGTDSHKSRGGKSAKSVEKSDRAA